MFHSRVKQRLVATVLGAVCLALSGTALALSSITLNFNGVSNTNIANTALGESSLFVEVMQLSNPSKVAFKFTNTSSSSIADVYFDDGSLLGIASISDSGTGVAFSSGASPSNLPGGSALTPAFITTAGFSADSDPPVSPNGVTVGEWLTITFNLQTGKTYTDVLSALALPNGGGTGDLRIGVHVQSFSNGGSESFVNTPVPEAETYAMILSGLGLVGFMARRRSRSLV